MDWLVRLQSLKKFFKGRSGGVPFRKLERLFRPGDLKVRVVPPASEFIGEVPVVGHGIEMDRVFTKEEPMGHAVRDDNCRRIVRVKLNHGGHSLSRGSFPEVTDPDGGLPDRKRQVVVMTNVDMDAAENAFVGRDDIPLDGTKFGPRLTKELREGSTRIPVPTEWNELHPFRKAHIPIIANAEETLHLTFRKK